SDLRRCPAAQWCGQDRPDRSQGAGARDNWRSTTRRRGRAMTDFDLDHVGIAVANLDHAAAKFRRLGFQLTPRGYHTLPPPRPDAERPRVGTGNHCAMLRRGYLELIGVTDPAYRGRLRADIARYEGLHIVAFGAADVAATARTMRSSGVE